MTSKARDERLAVGDIDHSFGHRFGGGPFNTQRARAMFVLAGFWSAMKK
jgi:hypothetical protein